MKVQDQRTENVIDIDLTFDQSSFHKLFKGCADLFTNPAVSSSILHANFNTETKTITLRLRSEEAMRTVQDLLASKTSSPVNILGVRVPLSILIYFLVPFDFIE